MSNAELLLKLFIQLVFILVTCRLMSFIGKRYFGQTTVVCEMIAGIFLGPSLLGLLFPEFQAWLFPHAPYELVNGQTIPNPSMSILFSISQLGLVFYMFLVGMEFNIGRIKQRFKSAYIVSFSGIIVPFFLGILLAITTSGYEFFYDNISPVIKAAYLGTCLSITAFPVMARILEENNITKTKLGTLALAAAAIDDLVAWILLAILLASIKGQLEIALFAISGAGLFILIMATMRKTLRSVQALLLNVPPGRQIEFNQPFIVILIFVIVCASFTDIIGIHTVFGAFIAGLIMPRGIFTEQVRIRIGNLTGSFFLPTFFVFSGLNTQISLLNTSQLWLITGLILIVAIVGKGVTGAIADRLTGDSWRNAATLGVLMNARGLMELIILNIGLEAKIITPTLFTILVIMAISTTLITSPLYYLIQGKERLPRDI